MIETPPLSPDLAARFARIALGHVQREYPNKLDHVLGAAADAQTPRHLHPIFYGSFDWHSCVHSYWMLARLARRYPGTPEAAATTVLFDASLTPAKVAGELAYLERPLSAGFERPYGWAWLLMLAGELRRGEDAAHKRWSAALAPLEAAFVARFEAHLPKLTYPIRSGSHASTAFALTLALDYAQAAGNAGLAALIGERMRGWFLGDRAAQAWEPSGDDFLSPTLIEAEGLRRVLPKAEFTAWFDAFLPGLAEGRPAQLLTPALVSDRSDGKLAHLDGLNFSRAWCFRGLAGTLDEADPRRAILLDAARRHIAASLPHVAGDYMGEHWLATFATLALVPAFARR